MDNQAFVPALLELKNSSPETVIKHFHRLFSQIAKLDVEGVTAAYQTVCITMQSSGLEHDPALRYVLSALHQRMIYLATVEDFSISNKTAQYFCRLLQIRVESTFEAEKMLRNHQIA